MIDVWQGGDVCSREAVVEISSMFVLLFTTTDCGILDPSNIDILHDYSEVNRIDDF
jgi:hypothetical protein